ncbi:hypothetical protein C8F01DRAFT_1095546 [Mycena amicta]|nr:hypothetical protein C8F01DRAFT_1095546 [Mycena amicta]
MSPAVLMPLFSRAWREYASADAAAAAAAQQALVAPVKKKRRWEEPNPPWPVPQETQARRSAIEHDNGGRDTIDVEACCQQETLRKTQQGKQDRAVDSKDEVTSGFTQGFGHYPAAKHRYGLLPEQQQHFCELVSKECCELVSMERWTVGDLGIGDLCPTSPTTSQHIPPPTAITHPSPRTSSPMPLINITPHHCASAHQRTLSPAVTVDHHTSSSSPPFLPAARRRCLMLW